MITMGIGQPQSQESRANRRHPIGSLFRKHPGYKIPRGNWEYVKKEGKVEIWVRKA